MQHSNVSRRKSSPFFLCYLVFFCLMSYVSIGVNAQEGFDDEEITVHLKKIRDDENNYMRNVTKAAAREISKSGEFKAKLYKRKATGPIISVQSASFDFAPYKDGMNTKELASAGLGLVTEVGSLFGFDKEASKASELNQRLNSKNSMLSNWGDGQQIMVTLDTVVTLIDDDTGSEIRRNVEFQQVFDSKDEFESSKEAIIQTAVVREVKNVLVEYLEDLDY